MLTSICEPKWRGVARIDRSLLHVLVVERTKTLLDLGKGRAQPKIAFMSILVRIHPLLEDSVELDGFGARLYLCCKICSSHVIQRLPAPGIEHFRCEIDVFGVAKDTQVRSQVWPLIFSVTFNW